jgi:serine/threonine-protein kinase RsbW/stage II sporulation protein AB (anti-sigma F factor)
VSHASWSISAVADEVTGVRQAAVGFAAANGVPDALLGDLRLAISEAVTNAVVHAFRHREQPGTVTVSVDVRPYDMAVVVVRDDGMGMSRRSDSPGLGLGLALIASLADQVEHRSPPDGAGFELWMRFRLDA